MYSTDTWKKKIYLSAVTINLHFATFHLCKKVIAYILLKTECHGAVLWGYVFIQMRLWLWWNGCRRGRERVKGRKRRIRDWRCPQGHSGQELNILSVSALYTVTPHSSHLRYWAFTLLVSAVEGAGKPIAGNRVKVSVLLIPWNKQWSSGYRKHWHTTVNRHSFLLFSFLAHWDNYCWHDMMMQVVKTCG